MVRDGRWRVPLPLVVLGMLLLALAVAGLVAGCGDNTTTTTTAGGGAVAPTTAAGGSAAPTGEPLKIGVLLPYSQVYAVLGKSITNGMQMYFDEVNNQAGGRPITVVKEDDENSPEVGLRKLRKLVEQDEIDILSGFVSTGVVYAARDYLHDNKVITVVSNAGGNELTRQRKSPYIFRASFSSWQVSYPMGKWVAENVSKKVFTAAADYGFGRESIANFLESYKAAGGTQVGEVWPALGTNDYSAVLTQIKQANPEAVYTFFSGSDALNFVKQFSEFGLKGQGIKLTGAGFTFTGDVLPAQGQAAAGAYGSLYWVPSLDNPANKAFEAAYMAKYGKQPDVFAMQGYDSARVIVDAVNAVGGNTSDKEALIAAMAKVTFDSPRGKFRFDPVTHNVIQNMYIFQIKDVGGTLQPVVVDEIGEVQDPGK